MSLEAGSDLRERLLEDLMARYQAADPEAAAELIRQVSPLLLRFLSSPAYTRRLAEDLLQDCWLRIHRARHTYRPGEAVLPWIFAIARHTRIDGYRRRRRVESHELAMERLPEVPGPAHESSDPDLLRWINALPDGHRDVIFMLKVSGMSLQEVARATSSTVGAVKQKAHRAYEKLRGRLAAEVVK
jgi:RNA polymerase sigma-70 factor (ECF subfamily)